MDASTPVLEVQQVAKSYGPIKALDGVNLTVSPGEFVALLGANGAGKTTLLQLLTGLFAPDSGTIKVLGNDLRRNAIKALGGIGVVFQQQTLDLELSVRANLLYHADLHGLPRRIARQRIDWALNQFGLTERARNRARTLSGGNRRRLELARALLHKPHVLLMDEATVGLDPASRRDILDEIVRLKSTEDIGVLWTTHLVDEIERADRLIVLRLGKIVFQGTRQDLLDQEKSADLAATLIKMMGEDVTDRSVSSRSS
jgi:ABC-2 type transport system ATP-binding protein